MNDSHPGDDRLVAFALEDSDLAEREEVEGHLGRCAECAKVAGGLAAALARYREAGPREAPARVLVELLEAQAEGRRRRSTGLFAAWRPVAALAAAATLALVFLGGYWIGQRAAPEGTEARESVPLTHPLPDPPMVAFQTAVAEE